MVSNCTANRRITPTSITAFSVEDGKGNDAVEWWSDGPDHSRTHESIAPASPQVPRCAAAVGGTDLIPVDAGSPLRMRGPCHTIGQVVRVRPRPGSETPCRMPKSTSALGIDILPVTGVAQRPGVRTASTTCRIAVMTRSGCCS